MTAETPLAQLLDRLENYYTFECEGGPLRNCVEWQRVKALLTDLEAAPPQKETTMKMEQEPGEMHWKDGWLFKRLDDGSVRIRVWRPFVAVPGPYETAVIPAAEWVSLIHHLGKDQTSEAMEQAKEFHGVI
jgi:hypothetical protein